MRKHILPYGDILCYCLMPNHFHWMVYVRETEIKIPTKILKHQGATNSHPLNEQGNANKKTVSNTKKHTKDNDGVTTSRPVKLRSFNLSIGILLRSYTRAINKEMNWSGSLFREETKAIPLINDKLKTLNNNNLYQPDYAETCFQYIHENPVKAKLVNKSEEWEFSSAADYARIRNGTLCNINLTRKMEII